VTSSGQSQPDEVSPIGTGILKDAGPTSATGLSATGLEIDDLVDRNYAAVYRYALRLSGCPATAEDIVQEVFARAVTHLHQLRERAAERGWLMAIARREFLRWLRVGAHPKQGHRVPLEHENLSTEDLAGQQVENRDWVQAALSLLNQDARMALLMYYFEDLSYAEIAQQQQIPIGTVMSRLSRGREQLRSALQRLNPNFADTDSHAQAISAGAHPTRLPLPPGDWLSRAVQTQHRDLDAASSLDDGPVTSPLAGQEAKHG